MDPTNRQTADLIARGDPDTAEPDTVKQRWILHLPTRLTSLDAAVELAAALRRSLTHLAELDLGEITLSEEDRQLLRHRVWCHASLPGGGHCALPDGHPGGYTPVEADPCARPTRANGSSDDA